jgi:hypothetical protein
MSSLDLAIDVGGINSLCFLKSTGITAEHQYHHHYLNVVLLLLLSLSQPASRRVNCFPANRFLAALLLLFCTAP